MNRKTFLTGLAAFYLISGCGAAWLTMQQTASETGRTTVDTTLVLPVPETETATYDPEPQTSPETDAPSVAETEQPESAVMEPESESIPEESLETEASEAETAEENPAVSYTYRAIHQKYRLFIRETPDASSKALGYLKPGETGDVISLEGDWVLLEHNGITGYVSSQFLELTEH